MKVLYPESIRATHPHHKSNSEAKYQNPLRSSVHCAGNIFGELFAVAIVLANGSGLCFRAMRISSLRPAAAEVEVLLYEKSKSTGSHKRTLVGGAYADLFPRLMRPWAHGSVAFAEPSRCPRTVRNFYRQNPCSVLG
jgi:hypothetical protein